MYESSAHERTRQERASQEHTSERVKSTRANKWKTTESKLNEAKATDLRTNEAIFQHSGESAFFKDRLPSHSSQATSGLLIRSPWDTMCS